ncbi:MAG: TatD family hydrolase [Flavobacteriales bacterium Tduv]
MANPPTKKKGMSFIDTHAHLYVEQFDSDREAVIQNALESGVKQFYLPSIDSRTLERMLSLEAQYPGVCIPMIGLHPISVRPDTIETELGFMKKWLDQRPFAAVGEIGIDLYWEQRFLYEQREAFRTQISWAKEKSLPIVIHSRSSFDDIFEILEQERDERLRGIFHCFSGTFEQARRAIDYGMKLGIGGIVTFKNGQIDRFLYQIDLKHIVLETDSPYLAPTPYRGKRNEPIYLRLILERLSHIYSLPQEEIAKITTENTTEIFAIH